MTCLVMLVLKKMNQTTEKGQNTARVRSHNVCHGSIAKTASVLVVNRNCYTQDTRETMKLKRVAGLFLVCFSPLPQ